MANPFGLTKKQLKNLDSLKLAYKRCIDSGMYPVNIYGNLTFYNAKYVSHYGDESDIGRHHDTGYSLELKGNPRTFNEIRIPNEFCDDSHILFFTEKGYKEYLKNEE